MNRRCLVTTAGLALVLLIALDSSPVGADDVVVSNVNDSGPGSLRQAIAVATQGDRITFDPALVDLTLPLESPLEITGGQFEISGLVGRINVVNEDGPALVISGGDLKIHDIDFQGQGELGGGVSVLGGTTEFWNMWVQYSYAEKGGGMYVAGGASAKLTDAGFFYNNATDGAGLYAAAGSSVRLYNTYSTANAATDRGGGLFFEEGVSVQLGHMPVTDNTATSGAGIYTVSNFYMRDASIVGNIASADGGGIAAHADIETVNATISLNQSGANGGGIAQYAGTELTIHNSTIGYNTAITGDALWQDGGIAHVDSTVFAEDGFRTMPICISTNGGTIESIGYNVSTDGSCDLVHPTDLPGYAAQIYTPYCGCDTNLFVQPPFRGSPLINRIPPGQLGCGSTMLPDVSGYSRPQGAACDIGAVELKIFSRGKIWGDVLCFGYDNTQGVLALLQFLADDYRYGGSDCPAFGTFVEVQGYFSSLLWPDLNCDGPVNEFDVLIVLQQYAGLSPPGTSSCPGLGQSVSVTP